MSDQMATIDRYLDHAAERGIPLAALMMSPQAFMHLKDKVPRKQYRQRQGSRFINAYRGVPIHIHDEWSWGWMLRAVDGSFPRPEDEDAAA